MGVPYYFYQLYKKYNDEAELMITERDIQNIVIDHLFFDYNSMIHPCAHQIIQMTDNCEDVDILEEKIIENCINYTRYILCLLKPINTYIMIDGVAPRAKINQQRERRYKSQFFKCIQEENTKTTWDSNKITPGTAFMNKLKIALDEFSKEMKNVIISDSNECGEGEHKMMKYISNNLHNKNEKICIYGLDADLIMLSLLNKYSDKIILLRDNSFNVKVNESQRNFTYLDIKRLKGSVCKEIRYYFSNNENKIEWNDIQIINDYIVLCFLLGNDFLEHIPSLRIKENGLHMLLKCYTSAISMNKNTPLINLEKINKNEWKDCINMKIFTDIFQKLADVEDYFFNKVYGPYKDKSKKIYRDTPSLDVLKSETVSQNGLYFYVEDCIKYNENGYKKRYYLYYGTQESELNNVCRDYIEGIHWIFGYYQNHIHDNWSWYYKHHAVPFASDIYSYLKRKEWIENPQIFTENLYLTKPNTTIEQLLMVLPKESLLKIIKEIDIKLYIKLIRLLRGGSKDLHMIYPRNILIDMIHKEYLWQSKILFEKFDKNFLNLILD